MLTPSLCQKKHETPEFIKESNSTEDVENIQTINPYKKEVTPDDINNIAKALEKSLKEFKKGPH